jgi:adenylate cyclase
MSKLKKRRNRSIWILILVAVIISQLYEMLYKGFGSIIPYINAFACAVLIALAAAYFEFFLYKNKIWKLSFPMIILIRISYYLILVSIIIFTEIAISRMIISQLSFWEVIKNRDFQHYIYEEDFFYAIIIASVIIFIVNFIMQINRKLGQGIIFNVITGRFVKPVKQDRIFMFIKINGAGSVLEKLGRFRFNAFINDFIYDITEPILMYSGEIYEYVDDMIVVTWKQRKGLSNSNCIRTFFEAKEQLRENREHYLVNYDCFPTINAACHCGQVIRGEVGFVKSTIVFTGDVMNTTSRILDQCQPDKSLLISGALMDHITLPPIYLKEFCGEFIPKGKNNSIQLHTIKEAILNFN